MRLRRPVRKRCCSPPQTYVGRGDAHKLPHTWRTIEKHPDLVVGAWVPRGDLKGVVFCESCGSFWYLFLDPAQYYYTHVIELAPELERILRADAVLGDVLPVGVAGDALLQLMIRDWFALADYDASAAAEAIVVELGVPCLEAHRAIRLLDFLAAVLARIPNSQVIELRDPAPLVELSEREDLVSLDPIRRASELVEIRRLLKGIVRAAFGTAYGGNRDRLAAGPDAKSRLVAAAAVGPDLEVAAWTVRRCEQVELLACEMEELLQERRISFTSGEIAALVEVVRAFWAEGEVFQVDQASQWVPGISLYRRCRDLLIQMRHAGLVPEESDATVAAALAIR